MRVSKVIRKTRETEVSINVNLDSNGKTNIKTGTAFLDHMLSSFATHSLIDVMIEAKGDLKHHIIEDVAICLGESLRKALGDGTGINRFGFSIVPMDDALAFSAIDLVRRLHTKIDLKLNGNVVEDMPCEDINHFFETLASNLEANIHLWIKYGVNDHHKVEAAIKALALSIKYAIAIDPRRKDIPSSKGVI